MLTTSIQRPHLLWWVSALVALVVGLAVLLVCLDAPSAQSSTLRILRNAEFQLPPPDATEPLDAAWQAVTLPDNWSRQRKEAQGIGWYRVKFDLPAGAATQQDLALHVKRLNMSGEFYINGHLLAPSLQTGVPVLRSWNTPQYRALPHDWLQPGANEIAVKLFAYRDYNGGLSALDLGPNAEVYARYQRTLFLHSTLTAAAIVALVVIGVLALAIGLRFARDGSPFFLGLCSVVWAARLINNYAQVIPLDWFWWGWIMHSLSGWVPLFMLLYFHRYLGLQRRGLEHFLIAYTVLCTALMGAFMAAWIGKDTLALLWLPFNLATSVYFLTILWRLLRHSVGTTPFMLAVALAFFLLGELHDRLISTASLEPWIGFEAAYWRPVSAMLLAVAFCLLVADEFVHAINEAKHSAVAQERALNAERERMNREMHDGLGAHLITALRGVERGVERGALSKEQVAQLLQDGLDELRLLMDSSDLGRSLHGALAAWRNQWDARLQAVGVNLNWQVDAALERLALGSDATLHIMRVLQEAVTNTVKHAHASEIHVRAQQQDQQLLLEIVDNGVGLPAQTTDTHRGRGVGNMHLRADRLGAQLRLEALTAPAQGTRVRLTLPWVEPA